MTPPTPPAPDNARVRLAARTTLLYCIVQTVARRLTAFLVLRPDDCAIVETTVADGIPTVVVGGFYAHYARRDVVAAVPRRYLFGSNGLGLFTAGGRSFLLLFDTHADEARAAFAAVRRDVHIPGVDIPAGVSAGTRPHVDSDHWCRLWSDGRLSTFAHSSRTTSLRG